ncbi:Glycosyl transferase family 11 [Roseimaritima multifibrata]|uniref:Glycosyl transferase family 11 n=1 Tax=Roseimaritima multifibrata TaxID=1930274 RepID=A0A517MB56_9BACT|nr:alpha-1,2-fucosyltransferase [Roseimaritima multifibrata]QDS92118.1 Glycosyl transferase family 11 [Roseimaritima multifibrata]
MIVSHILGGLGNQMFQYAYGRWLADRWDVPHYLDLREFAGYGLHAYQLDYFPHRAVALPPELESRCPQHLHGARVRIAAKLPDWMRRGLCPVRERPFGFRPAYLKARPNSYLWGYWQSESFFPGHRETILQDFAFPESTLSPRTREVAQAIEKQPSVFLHVRRGDYVTDPQTKAIYLSMGRDYYRAALDDLLQRQPNLHAYLFTNDPEWCRKEFDVGIPLHIVDHNNAATCQEDLYLMSRCQYGVTANSSFSWWGAYLMTNPQRRVYAPAAWTATGRDDSHLPVADWQVLPVEGNAPAAVAG